MRVDLFDYELPTSLIAQAPLESRDSSRLLVLDRQKGTIEHRRFLDLGDYLRPEDCLVVNNTQVLPARLRGIRESTGGKWEGLYLRSTGGLWEIMLKSGGRPQPGEYLVTDPDAPGQLRLQLVSKESAGTWWVRPEEEASAIELLQRVGHVPIPPYIRQGLETPLDRLRYQTVYAAVPGAVAAPTAGLHFTEDLLTHLIAMGVVQTQVTLHVGPGTFQPMKVHDTDEHVMHAEWCSLTPKTAETIRSQRERGGRVVAVGTTAVRTLEAASQNGALAPFEGETNLFIVPPYQFRSVDLLITNFHLPKSTLLMLVSAFAGREQVLEAYREAVRSGYRFYSYGDAMLIL